MPTMRTNGPFTKRLPAMVLLAAALASGGGAGAGAQSGSNRSIDNAIRVAQADNAIRVAQADTDRTLAGPTPGADPIIGATDVLAPPETLTLIHPNVVTTARLQADAASVNLSGIDGEAGDAAQGLQAYLAAAGDRVDCRPQGDAGHLCVMPDGDDVAEVALANGAARARPDAPAAYREQEIAAQTARRGLWANLPPPPETVQHPIVRDTGSVASATKTYTLDGVMGLEAPYAGQLQDYIAAHGDSVTCSPQGEAGNYVCLLPDGTDIAKVALVNGAARVGPDAPDPYRAQQLDALNNRRGFWLAASDDVITEALTPPLQTEYVLAAGDDAADGISYAGGTPMAVIDGAPVFLAFAAGLGWGFYDHDHHWHGAPGRYRAHLEHFHPEGRGLPGFGYHREAMRHDAALRPGDVGHRGSAAFESPVRPGLPVGMQRPGVSGPPPLPGPSIGPSGHPGMIEPLRQPEPIGLRDHPWMNAPVGRPGMSGPAVQHPGGMAMAGPRFAAPPGSGFTNQRAAPPGGFRPPPGPAMRAAGPPPHANAVAVRRQ